jgi:hypothetical protein
MRKITPPAVVAEIRRLRTEELLSQRQIADRLKLTRTVVEKYTYGMLLPGQSLQLGRRLPPVDNRPFVRCEEYRCPACGHLTNQSPCACSRTCRITSALGIEPLGLDLLPDEFGHYLEVKRNGPRDGGWGDGKTACRTYTATPRGRPVQFVAVDVMRL